MAANNIKVICRFRPQNKREISEGGIPITTFSDEATVLLDGQEYRGPFTFDRVFGMDTGQEEIFEYAAKTTVEDVLNGYNGTVFAYGQTGSGKTFTMMGADIDSELKGLIPRLTQHIFNCILDAPEHMEFTVKVSYMEIYMERIKDLLNPSNDNLPVHEEKTRGVYVKGLIEVYVSSADEVFEVMRRGGQSRVVAYTKMNAESSRSHSIFVITITQKNLKSGTSKAGRLYLVDLAGSEKVGKTGASGQTLEEAKKINKSLTSLGMVINALTDGKSSYVPYRDSKLTRILQESLGGNSRTTLIINASPSSFNETETLSTLRFGTRAKTIKNRAKVNAELSPQELKNLLKKSEASILSFKQFVSLLEGELGVWRGGGTVSKEDQVTRDKFDAGKVGAASATSGAGALSPSLASRDSGRIVAQVSERLSEEERAKFIERENELVDELSSKEKELESQKAVVMTLQEEAEIFRAGHGKAGNLTKDLQQAKLQLERASFENKESRITIDSLKEANRELADQLDQMKELMTEMEKTHQGSNREAKKVEMMQRMMSDIDPSNMLRTKEAEIRTKLNALLEPNGVYGAPHGSGTPDRDSILNLDARQNQSAHDPQKTIQSLQEINSRLLKSKEDLETRLLSLENEYEDLLDKTIAEEETANDQINDFRSKVEASFNVKRERLEATIGNLKTQLEEKEEESRSFTVAVADLKKTNSELRMAMSALKQEAQNAAAKFVGNETPDSDKDKDLERFKTYIAQQRADFDQMKRSLTSDLQNRCEKVVELEVSLGDVREQYNNMLKNSNVRATQKKMAFLERNLEQLTVVQKRLVEQNTALKKDISVASKKLSTRADRIKVLEDMLEETQTKVEMQRQYYEGQQRQLINKLQEARASANAGQEWAWGRVTKPLRGGGAPIHVIEDDDAPKDGMSDGDSKRSSWFNVSGFLSARRN